MHRKADGRPAQGPGRGTEIVTIALPSPGEGVSRALRNAYRLASDALPDDMLALLAKLDKH